MHRTKRRPCLIGNLPQDGKTRNNFTKGAERTFRQPRPYVCEDTWDSEVAISARLDIYHFGCTL